MLRTRKSSVSNSDEDRDRDQFRNDSPQIPSIRIHGCNNERRPCSSKERLQSLVTRGEIYNFRVVCFLLDLFSFGRGRGLNAFKRGQEQATMRRRCLGVRWESPRKQWPCSSTREMAKLLPSAGIVEKVFNYLIDRVTGANATPSGVSCCTAAKLHSQKGTILEGTTRVGVAHSQILV